MADPSKKELSERDICTKFIMPDLNQATVGAHLLASTLHHLLAA